jgi:FkbH-like protein
MGLRPDRQLLEKCRKARGNVAATIALAREIEAEGAANLTSLRVAVLSTFTSEPLQPFMVVEGAIRGFALRLLAMPFNQLELQAFKSDSDLYASRADVIVIASRLEDTAPALIDEFLTLSPQDVDQHIGAFATRVRTLVSGLRARTAAPILIWNNAQPWLLAAGLADPAISPSQAGVVERANAALAEIARGTPSVHVFDYSRLTVEQGLHRLVDRRLWHRARMPFSGVGLEAIAARTARYLSALFRPACKCLVVDLDNTLWGGVLAEDGIGGIALGEDHPGSIYKAFQRYLLSLRSRGLLLAIASKNDRDEALSVLATHSDGILRPDHFAAIEIGWHDKATSLRRIANELSVSTSALAFCDDSAVEREWIRAQLPEVSVIEMPEDPLQYVPTLDDAVLCETLRLSSEDRSRAEMYGAEAGRRRQHGEVALEDFLKALEIQAEVGPVDVATLPRVAQLLARTNQFNTTTRRYSEAQVSDLVAGGAVVLWVRVRDRFGDSGLVGLAIASPDLAEAGVWHLDSLVLSCRVIGRGIERVLLRETIRSARGRGAQKLIGHFVTTAKNEPASSVFSDNGFSMVTPDRSRWIFDCRTDQLPLSPHIRVIIKA